MNTLTSKQLNLLNFIREYISRHGFAPTFAEMKEHMGSTSNQTIHDKLSALEKKGYITRSGSARAITLTKKCKSEDESLYEVWKGDSVRMRTTDKKLAYRWAEVYGNLKIVVKEFYQAT